MCESKFNLEKLVDSKEKLTRDILLGFHTQFAENQRTREQIFTKILGFLGAVIIGYVYVYNNYWDDVVEFSIVAIAGGLLLMFGGLVIMNMAYSFRRDQYINARIRRFCGVLGDDKIFLDSYDPSVSLKNINRILNWMPGFLSVLFCVFPLFQILLFTSYAYKLSKNSASSNTTCAIIFVAITISLSVIVVLAFYIVYFAKLRKKLGITKSENDDR